MFDYSFWSDEAYISGIARNVVAGGADVFSSFNLPGILYQKLHLLQIVSSFKIFGISETAARIPSMVYFVVGVFMIFLLAKKLSGIQAAIISSFLYGLSHLNLAYATQARPYTAIQTLLLAVILMTTLIKSTTSRRQLATYNFLAITFALIATFLHIIGVFVWIVYFSFIFINFGKKILKNPLAIIGIASLSAIIFYPAISLLISSGKIFAYNHLYQVTKLFSYKYALIALPALIGFFVTFRKNGIISWSIFLYSVTVLLMSTFEIYTFNIRYVLSLFGLMFLYFGIFWAEISVRYFRKSPWLIPLLIVVVIYGTGYKISRTSLAYHNPNIDKYGDVQIANYKDFYAKLKTEFPAYKNLYVVNDLFDTENWYFGRFSNAYFMKFTEKPRKHHTADAMVYGSLEDFKKIMKKHPKGLLIMEDWQSFLPDDIKSYAKKNLKLEFRVESLKEATGDPWPLALYSWGNP